MSARLRANHYPSAPGKTLAPPEASPRAPATLEPAEFAPLGFRSPAPAPQTVIGLPARCVLVAEDDPDQRLLYQRLLSRLGWLVLAAEDGQAAWESFQEEPSLIDLVLTDFNMPRLDGAGLARRVRELRPEMPVVLVTGGPYMQQVYAAEPPASLILKKPFTKAELAEVLDLLFP
ncbi:MAG: response regulator [Deltaproteobacteria bacterium]|nr:response regulator [Deltaproteobacteria bacterium]